MKYLAFILTMTTLMAAPSQHSFFNPAFVAKLGGSTPPPPPGADRILQEDGFGILLEDGTSFLLQEFDTSMLTLEDGTSFLLTEDGNTLR